MLRRASAAVLLVALLWAGCNSLLGITDPTLGNPSVDAGPKTYGGQIFVGELTAFGAEPSDFAWGGGYVHIAFGPTTGDAPPFRAGAENGPIPCFANVFDVTANPSQVPPTLDEGPVTVNLNQQIPDAGPSASDGGPSYDAGVPVSNTFPSCTFQGPVLGYRCVAESGSQGSIGPSSADPNEVALFTPSSGGFGNDVGRYFLSPGAGLNLPITGNTAGTLAMAEPNGPLTLAATGSWMVVAGGGPIPFLARAGDSTSHPWPGFLNAGDTVQVTLTASPSGPFSSFTSAILPVGGKWSLDTGSRLELAGTLNLSTVNDVAYACNSGTGLGCGTATGFAFEIDTTDGSVTTGCNGGACGEFDMPTPAHYAGVLQCGAIGQSITIPHGLLNALAAGNPTRLQISISRVTEDAQPMVTVVVGFGYLKIQ